MTGLSVENLSFAFQRREIFKGFNAQLAPGETVLLTGPSGVGKTTLARLIAGHLKPSGGKIILNGRDVTGRAHREIFLVSQDNDLFPWQTALQHVEFVYKVVKKNAGPVTPMEALRMMCIEQAAGEYPKALSGGMQKRLALARALVLDPKVMILDEVFGSQHQQLRDDLLKTLLPHWQKRATSTLIVTHDPELTKARSIQIH